MVQRRGVREALGDETRLPFVMPRTSKQPPIDEKGRGVRHGVDQIADVSRAHVDIEVLVRIEHHRPGRGLDDRVFRGARVGDELCLAGVGDGAAQVNDQAKALEPIEKRG